MGKASRDKGARGELELIAALHAHGFTRARRNFGSGSSGGGDIADPPPGTVFEVKRYGSRFNLNAAIAQAEDAARDTDVPIVAHRGDGQPWRATLPLGDLLELLAMREAA